MNVLQLKLNDVVYFDDHFIRITRIEFSSTSCSITYDILDGALFQNKIAWSHYVIYKQDFNRDFFL